MLESPIAQRFRQVRRLMPVSGKGLVILALVLLLFGASAGWVFGSRWDHSDGSVTASGTLEADEVRVGSEVPGRIVDLAREGQQVRSQDVVVRLDDSLIQLQVRQAPDPATQQLLLRQSEDYQLRSPLSGVVTRVPTHIGEVVSPGQTALTVADLSRLKLTAYILERDLGRVGVGQRVDVSTDPFPDRIFTGIVTSINSQAEFTPRNLQTRADRLGLVFGVDVDVNNPDGSLKPGMPADATFLPAP